MAGRFQVLSPIVIRSLRSVPRDECPWDECPSDECPCGPFALEESSSDPGAFGLPLFVGGAVSSRGRTRRRRRCGIAAAGTGPAGPRGSLPQCSQRKSGTALCQMLSSPTGRVTVEPSHHHTHSRHRARSRGNQPVARAPHHSRLAPSLLPPALTAVCPVRVFRWAYKSARSESCRSFNSPSGISELGRLRWLAMSGRSTRYV